MTQETKQPTLHAYREYITDKASFAIDDDGSRLGETPNIAMDANTPELAAFIVRACNAHDELVDTLSNVRGIIQMIDDIEGGQLDMLSQIDAALAKARGEA